MKTKVINRNQLCEYCKELHGVSPSQDPLDACLYDNEFASDMDCDDTKQEMREEYKEKNIKIIFKLNVKKFGRLK